MSWAFPLRRVTGSLAILTALTAATPTAARADVVFVLSGPDFSGSTPVAGNITVTIANILNGVTIAIANNLVGAGAFLGDLYLNTSVAPLANPVGSCVNCGAINNVAPTFNFGSNAFQADGDGLYDIALQFSNAMANRLTPGESITLSITSTTAGFNEGSFNSLSAPGGGNGPFVIAAHVQALPPNDGSAWITTSTVPEPGTMMLVGTGLFGLVARRRSLRKNVG